MSPRKAPRWLLIGNSRWHWAERLPDGQLRGWDSAGESSQGQVSPLLGWAAVGPEPDPLLCPPQQRIVLGDVPLKGCPPWLGVDRALAAWGAWQMTGGSSLVVDAGTVLSLTRVDGSGTFQGGRLLAGVRLQQEAMAKGTHLISPPLAPAGVPGLAESDASPPWPQATSEAMAVGVVRGLAAAVVAAAREAACQWVVLTGGDSPALHRRIAPQLKNLGLAEVHCPLLCLESLARLRPEH